MSQKECIDGARIIAQMLGQMAGERGLSLAEVSWLPDPGQEQAQQSSQTYRLIVAAGERIVRQTLAREALEDARQSKIMRNGVKVLLAVLLRELL